MESQRVVLETLLVVSSLAVWLAVFLEKETFSKKTQRIGWRLLVIALGAETLLTARILVVDAQITRELITAVAPRVVTTTQLENLVTAWRRFSGQQVSLSVAGYDDEARSLAVQIVSALKAAGMEVRDHTEDGMFEIQDLRHAGITVRGKNPELVKSLTAELRGIGLIVSEVGYEAPPGQRADPEAAARIYVGHKPVPSATWKQFAP